MQTNQTFERPVPQFSPLRTLRESRKMSLNELAHAAQIDPAHLELLERGSDLATPRLVEMQALARALGVPVSELR